MSGLNQPSEESPLVFRDEADRITGISDVTRKRGEAKGTFPKRIALSPRRVAHKRAELLAWCADPEGWAKRNKASA